MSATPGEAELAAFAFAGDDDNHGPSSMTVDITETSRLTVTVETTSSTMTIGVS